MHKITKTQLKKFLKVQHPAIKVQVFLTTSKTHLAGYKNWIDPVEHYLGNDLEELEQIITEFKNENCNPEDGMVVHYYLKGE